MARRVKRSNLKVGDLDDMMAYVDEFGNISDTPPAAWCTKKKKLIRVKN